MSLRRRDAMVRRMLGKLGELMEIEVTRANRLHELFVEVKAAFELSVEERESHNHTTHQLRNFEMKRRGFRRVRTADGFKWLPPDKRKRRLKQSKKTGEWR